MPTTGSSTAPGSTQSVLRERRSGRRVRAGRLIPLHRGVYAVGHRRLTQRGRWLAAVRALGDGRGAEPRATPRRCGICAPPPGGPVHVTVAPGGRARRAGLIVHRSRSLGAGARHRARADPGRPASPRTLSDLAGTLEAAALARAVEAARVAAAPRRPQRARAPRRDAPARHGSPISSPPSRITPAATSRRRWSSSAGDTRIERPRTNVVVHGHLVDCHWPEHRVVAELDSWRFHNTRAAFERDRERDADLQAHGFATLRFTYAQVTAPRAVGRLPAQAGTRVDVLRVDLLLRAGPARERQRRVRAALQQRLQVGAVLAQDRQRALAVERRAVARARRARRRSTSGSSRSASPGRRTPTRSRRSTGSRPARGSRRTTSTSAHGIQIAMPSSVWPSVGCSSSSRSPIPQWPGTGSACGAGSVSGRGPLDVVLLVEVAQLALRRARLVAQPRRARLGDAQRRVGERVAAEQVVPVDVRRQAADDAEVRLLRDRRQQLELVGQDRRVDAERLVARAHERAGRLPEPRRDDDDVGVQPDGLHR